jgi:ubiquinone/menaquinone biosynthesis C-methylase UbiE
MTPLWIVAGLAIIMFLARRYAAEVYDIIIVKMTQRWYAAVLEDIGKSQRILDVGIGTATALIKNKDLVVKNDIKVVGVDYEEAYVTKAQDMVQSAGLKDRVVVFCLSIYDDIVPSLVKRQLTQDGEEAFDAVYFSGSLTVMPDPLGALKVAAGVVKKGGYIYVTQTYQRQAPPGLKWLKPMMKYLTTIDFGKLTFEKDLDDLLRKSGFKIVKNEVIKGSIDNRFQAARIVILQP